LTYPRHCASSEAIHFFKADGAALTPSVTARQKNYPQMTQMTADKKKGMMRLG